MRRLTRTSSAQRTPGRLMAILLALLLAMGTLTSHGAMEHLQADCGVVADWSSDGGHSDHGPSVEHDHDASSCALCSVAAGQARLALVDPLRQANSPAMAASPQPPLAPRRPPKS
ncbi:DUF2946 family protein [Franzmannia qiaohouensis]|uniref:DUF2946 family protein n=1 Tax=Franzmannia qiaohouensis TaxID=1329370 RepID=UPI003BEF0AEE